MGGTCWQLVININWKEGVLGIEKKACMAWMWIWKEGGAWGGRIYWTGCRVLRLWLLNESMENANRTKWVKRGWKRGCSFHFMACMRADGPESVAWKHGKRGNEIMPVLMLLGHSPPSFFYTSSLYLGGRGRYAPESLYYLLYYDLLLTFNRRAGDYVMLLYTLPPMGISNEGAGCRWWAYTTSPFTSYLLLILLLLRHFFQRSLLNRYSDHPRTG